MVYIYRLGVLSDTHVTKISTAVELASQLLEGPFAQVDAILHAGDMAIPELESCFGGIPFYAVQGNMDKVRLDLPLKRIVDVAGYRIGLIHGWGPPSAVPHNALSEFEGDPVDLLVFGHSHTPYHEVVGQVLMFNPGSATDHRGNAESCSIGLVEIGKTLTAVHIPFTLTT